VGRRAYPEPSRQCGFTGCTAEAYSAGVNSWALARARAVAFAGVLLAAAHWRLSCIARSAASAVSRGFSMRTMPSSGGSLWLVVVV
jgi:hypothetical protein